MLVSYTNFQTTISDILLQAIDDWVFKTPGLRALLLNEDEWDTLREIADILEVRVYSVIILTTFLICNYFAAIHRGDFTDVT